MLQWAVRALLGLMLVALACGLAMPDSGHAQESAPPCGEVVFSDEFSNPDSGWPTDSGEGFDWAYDEGEYRVFVTEPGYIAWSWAPLDQGLPDNFCLGVETKQLVQGSLSETGTEGLIFAGNSDQRRFHMFEVSPSEGEYRITKLLHGFPDPLFEWTQADAINGVNEFNHLQIRVQGDQAYFFINDVQVKTLTMEAGGDVGVFTRAFDAPNVNGRFDNFTVRHIGSTD